MDTHTIAPFESLIFIGDNMEWIIAVIRWDGVQGDLLIQTEDERLYKLVSDDMSPDSIGQLISERFNIPRNRVCYHDTKQTLYRRLTYMRFVVCE